MIDDPRGPRRYRYRCDKCGWGYLTWADSSDGTPDPVCSKKPPGILHLIEVLRIDAGGRRAKRAATRASKRRFLHAIKLTCGCIDCGYREDPTRLSFDHRADTVKDFNVGHGVKGSWRLLIAEIEKCEVRCLVCHAARHDEEGNTFRALGVARSPRRKDATRRKARRLLRTKALG
jgi:hypothetical protein